jgi:NAD(P)-dependent dehydrogenase (short-subunit alcohol dehydrogenase family)
VPTAIVTGATGAIGEAIARGIADRGWRVVLGCRDVRRGAALARRLEPAAVEVAELDVGSRASIDAFRARFEGPLDALVNNAAIAPKKREVTSEGIERQLAVNVLGYLRMIEAFADALERGTSPRIVNVASYWAGDLDEHDLEFVRRRYDNNAAYRQSKQANRMLTVAHAERLRSRGIAVNACHPGDVSSTLSHDLGFGGSESAEEGARTPLFLALDPQGASATGNYFANERAERDAFARDRAAIERLFERCVAYG